MRALSLLALLGVGCDLSLDPDRLVDAMVDGRVEDAFADVDGPDGADAATDASIDASDSSVDSAIDTGCAGCFMDGSCVDGTERTACGTGGTECTACLGSANTCVDGRCQVERAAVDLAAGLVNSCAIDRLGALWCWGDVSRSIHGSDPEDGFRAVRVGTREDWRSVTLGDDFFTQACAIDADGSLHCWGEDIDGQLGLGPSPGNTTVPTSLPALEGRFCTDVSAGPLYALAICEGRVWAWGENSSFRLGVAGAVVVSTPMMASTTVRMSRVAAGDGTGYAIGEDGMLYSWGSDSDGQLGSGGVGARETPDLATTLDEWDSITAGRAHACGMRGSELRCWGAGQRGQLARPTTSESSPVVVPPMGTAWTRVSAAGDWTCAVNAGGELYCWGANDFGQLGREGADGTSPERITIAPVSDVTLGPVHACAIAQDGAVWCFGANGSGQTSDPCECIARPPYRVVLGRTAPADTCEFVCP